MTTTPATEAVTYWYLEQTAPGDLRPAREIAPGAPVRIERAAVPSPEFSRFLYTAVGQDVAWIDRLPWDRSRWRAQLERPGVETWVLYEHGTPGGFIELSGEESGVVEIGYFGLLPAFRGRGLGGALLSAGTARAWDLADRTPGHRPTGRVWLHTCSRDGEHALDNYRRRGFRVYDTRTAQEPYAGQPGPWPGA